MKKQHLFIILAVVLLGFVFAVVQYYQALKTEDVSAVTVGTPNPGHSLAQLECSADSLCVDTANNRVGIGTANPGNKLSVWGTNNGTAVNLLELRAGGGTLNTETGIIWNESATKVGGIRVIDQGATTRMSFDTYTKENVLNINADNVGIGTTSPSNKLTIASTTTGDGIRQSSSSYISVPNTYTTLFTLSNKETVVFLVNIMCDYLNGYSYLLMATGSSYNGGSLAVISGPTGNTGGTSMSFQMSSNSIQAKQNYTGLTLPVNVIVLTRSIF